MWDHLVLVLSQCELLSYRYECARESDYLKTDKLTY